MSIDYAKARETMVEQQIRPWEVSDARVLETLTRMPRELFVAEAHRALAYADLALPIGHGEFMMKPVLEGRVLQALGIAPGDDVLDIGTGSGFLAACMGNLARDVLSIEQHSDLAQAARQRIDQQGIRNVRIEVADALQWQSERRFDTICVGGAVATIPERFLHWLRPGGRMFVVRGQAPAMEAVLVRRASEGDRFEGDRFKIESLFETELLYLTGMTPVARFEW